MGGDDDKINPRSHHFNGKRTTTIPQKSKNNEKERERENTIKTEQIPAHTHSNRESERERNGPFIHKQQRTLHNISGSRQRGHPLIHHQPHRAWSDEVGKGTEGRH